MLEEIISKAELRMEKSIAAFNHELTTIRTGRAHPDILQHIMVDYYGTATPLAQVANIAVEDARTLSVTPWEKTMVGAIEKAILTANLGLNPTSAGVVIRIPLPPLTEDRRRELVKTVKDMAEGARVSIRNVRRDANGECRRLLKDKQVTEDDVRGAEDRIQKLTDSFIDKAEKVLSDKEKDLLEV